MTAINVAVEGPTDLVIVKSILAHLDIDIQIPKVERGINNLLPNLPKYNQAARFAPWLVVLDLDRHDCAVAYVAQLVPERSPNLYLRVAVRMIEAWLLADREHIAAFLDIAPVHVPKYPDNEGDPKHTLVNLARKSRRQVLRNDMIPDNKSYRKVGPGYEGRIAEFVRHASHPWRPDIAMTNSESLHRCIRALQNWKEAK